MGNENSMTKAELRHQVESLRSRIRELENRPDPYRVMVESLPQMIFETDLDGKFTYVNDFALKTHGFSREDFNNGLSITDTIHPDYLAHSMRSIKEALADHPSHGIETMGLRKDGSSIPVKIFFQPLFRDGKRVGLRGVVMDISDIRQAEAALVESEKFHRTLFETTGTAMVTFNNDGVIRRCNSQFEILSGYPMSSILGEMQWTRFVAPEDLKRLHSYHDARAVGDQAPTRYDFTFLARGNVSKRVHMVIALTQDTGDRVCSLIDITESENAREALRKSEERYELVVRGAYDGIWDWDLGSDMIYFSPRYKAILGYRDDEMQNSLDSLRRALHPEDRERVLAIHKQCIDGEQDHFEIEFRMRHKDGSYRLILARSTSGMDKDGNCSRLAGTITDITEWKKTDQALKRSEQQYRDIFTYASNGIFQSTPAGRLITANAAAARLMGYDSPKQLLEEMKDVGTQCYDSVEDRYRLLELIKQKGHIEGYEMPFRQRDGTPIWVSCNVRAIMNENGEIACFEGFLQDITERKINERTTQAMYAISKAISTTGDLQDLYATIHTILDEGIDATNFYIGLLDSDKDRIVLPYFEDERDSQYEITNVSDPSSPSLTAHVVRTGKPLLVTRDDIRSPAHMERIGCIGSIPAVWLGVPLKTRSVVLGAMAVQHYTNPTHYSNADVSFLEAVSEQVAMAIERKANEEELTRLNEELESKVRERTVELETKATQLVAANNRLKELDEIKSNLVSSVSHELRTPLTSIRGFAKLTGKEFHRHFMPLAISQQLKSKGDRIRRNLDIINTEGKRLTRLINDFLDLNRIESGNAKWNDSLINLCDVARQSVESVVGTFAENPKVRLITEFPPTAPSIYADPDKIKQVLINLLNNAFKFTNAGEIRVSLTAENSALHVAVADTGIGIAPLEQPLIFDKFHKIGLGDTMIGDARGTGLGLAICKEIVEHYQGSIWVESEYGAGSVFHFTLPAVSGEEHDCTASDIGLR
ncbi:PAS domain S-box protein [Pseudodesulfovibrio sp.]|uniref:PAS domain S-box protein n=1 Tax=unclassified Pseudodesulfovibrio TaxID=2661612 RepID=UPI003B001CB1